jgi:hypothetical protein
MRRIGDREFRDLIVTTHPATGIEPVELLAGTDSAQPTVIV